MFLLPSLPLPTQCIHMTLPFSRVPCGLHLHAHKQPPPTHYVTSLSTRPKVESRHGKPGPLQPLHQGHRFMVGDGAVEADDHVGAGEGAVGQFDEGYKTVCLLVDDGQGKGGKKEQQRGRLHTPSSNPFPPRSARQKRSSTSSPRFPYPQRQPRGSWCRPRNPIVRSRSRRGAIRFRRHREHRNHDGSSGVHPRLDSRRMAGLEECCCCCRWLLWYHGWDGCCNCRCRDKH